MIVETFRTFAPPASTAGLSAQGRQPRRSEKLYIRQVGSNFGNRFFLPELALGGAVNGLGSWHLPPVA